MEFEEHFLWNCASIAATILAATIAIIIIIRKLRLRWPVKANCWFCNTNTKIWRSEIDWWRCSSCHQYNGFTMDGDYNYDIPEQRSRSLNDSRIYTASCRAERAVDYNNKNTLCKNCNRNEEMKISQMRLIDPKRLSDDEIECFRQSLEKQYPLCLRCNSLVKRVLQKQSLWITQYKMLLFKQRPIKFIVKNSEKLEKYCRIILTILSSIIICYPKYQALPIIGAILQLYTATRGLNRRYISHVSLILTWLTVCTLIPFCDNHLMRYKLFRSQWLTLESITGYQVVTFLSTILGLANATLNNSSSTNPNVSFKRLESPGAASEFNMTLNSSTDEHDNYLNEEPIASQTEKKSPINITHLLTSSSRLEAPALMKSTPNFRVCNSQQSFSSLVPSPDPLEFSSKTSPQIYAKTAFNDSLRTLSNLSLSETSKKISPKNPKVFETRTYGTTSPDLFRKDFKSKKFILSPPKLKSVTQNSWVAGGYWQMATDRPTLSRSSSQSSGFGSTGSNFAPSREPSVVNDVDRCSIMSDNTLCCHYQPQTSITPGNSFCQYGSSQCRLINQEMPICMSPSSSLMSNTSCNQLSQRTICHNYHANDQCLKNGGGILQKNQEVCGNHGTTVLTSPVWLPALLCGSIVFNMIVFCTVLLRG